MGPGELGTLGSLANKVSGPLCCLGLWQPHAEPCCYSITSACFSSEDHAQDLAHAKHMPHHGAMPLAS